MGYYIQGPTHGKIPHIISMGGNVIQQPKSFDDIPEDVGLICVVDNGPFEAAAFCFSEREFEAFSYQSDQRPKTWMILDIEKAKKESGYNR